MSVQKLTTNIRYAHGALCNNTRALLLTAISLLYFGQVKAMGSTPEMLDAIIHIENRDESMDLDEDEDLLDLGGCFVCLFLFCYLPKVYGPLALCCCRLVIFEHFRVFSFLLKVRKERVGINCLFFSFSACTEPFFFVIPVSYLNSCDQFHLDK